MMEKSLYRISDVLKTYTYCNVENVAEYHRKVFLFCDLIKRNQF